MTDKKYVIGLDFGSDSGRAIVVNAMTGDVMASAVKYYPRWKDGLYCDPSNNQYRHHPLDYIETLEQTIKESLAQCSTEVVNHIVGIAFDTTGSTPVLTDETGTPLALLPEYAENPNAMFVLWKDHTAIQEAAKINQLAKQWDIDYTAYEGGIYDSEWVWAKMAHLLRVDKDLHKKAYAWIELCDWLPALISGKTKPEEVYRNRCAAGHKAMWSAEWDGLPPEEFLTAIEPSLAGFREHLYQNTYTGGTKIGELNQEWAERFGLSTSVSISVGALDCHTGAVGAGIKPRTLVRVIGTSTCDIMVSSYEEMENKLIPGICGQVDGSVLPGMIGMEAGQSSFGDIYAWFKRVLAWPIENILAQSTLIDEETKKKLIEETIDHILPALTKEAEQIPVNQSSILAVDWMNGRRTPDADPLVKGSITGLNLASSAPLIFKALVEATAFGSKAIIDRFLKNGQTIESVIGIGGIALKSPFIMQTLADVLNMPIQVSKAEQACALGSAIFAAVGAGIYQTVEEAQEKMNQGFAKEYYPNPEKHLIYQKIYEKYLQLGAFTDKELFNK
ncbi:MAG: ribulokinase [Parabacteroides sp.]|nr:ribulokinase [Parabacteroides sp.]